jgi:periplasmic protein TonB
MNRQQSMDDIIFEHRNKNYGAYLLRTAYSSTLLKSLFTSMTLALVIALCCFAFSKKALQTKIPFIISEQNPVHTTPVDLRPKSAEQKRESLASASRKKPGQAALIIRDSLVFNKDTTQILTEVTEQKKENQGFLGEGNSEKKGIGKSETTGTGTKSDTLVALVADEYPEFEGGMAALNRWIASRLRYPEDAIDHTKQGKVHVKFIVDEQGQVQFPVAMNKLGYGLEEEALRVVAGIPKFKSPAKIKGQAVKCYFVLPINFKLY